MTELIERIAEFRLSPTMYKVYNCVDKDIIIAMGVPGSGKTMACLLKILKSATLQPPSNGVRYSRWAVIRGTYPELKSTTIKSFEELVPPELAPVKGIAPLTANLKERLPDGTYLDTEFLFIAADDERAVKKLQSLNLTGLFINELSTVDKAVFDMGLTRIGRFPNASMGGIFESYILCDTNATYRDNWIVDYMENPPSRCGVFVQPAPLIPQYDDTGNIKSWTRNPMAENLENLNQKSVPEGHKPWTFKERREFGYEYYERQLEGKSRDWLDMFIANRHAASMSGRGVYAGEWDERMVSEKPLVYDPAFPLVCGFDTSGLNPAVLFAQVIGGTVCVLHELMALETSMQTFLDSILLPFIRNEYGEKADILMWLDFANPRNSYNEMRPTEQISSRGLKVRLAPTNKFSDRYETVVKFMRRENGLLIDKSCVNLLSGLRGKYQFQRVRVVGVREAYRNEPTKNEYSHLNDALQYLLMGVNVASNQENLRPKLKFKHNLPWT